jgi:hypothetical protein
MVFVVSQRVRYSPVLMKILERMIITTELNNFCSSKYSIRHLKYLIVDVISRLMLLHFTSPMK